ncbi:MAG: hypothetical protein VX930_02060, partial [Pseudomonadota bacterium]|nr:hypothetical protein [Pseudomonadota bacterium]
MADGLEERKTTRNVAESFDRKRHEMINNPFLLRHKTNALEKARNFMAPLLALNVTLVRHPIQLNCAAFPFEGFMAVPCVRRAFE